MKNLLFLISYIVVGCAKPAQPPLTNNEKIFFKTLTSNFKCEVQRTIDVTLLERFASENKRGGYALVLFMNCERLKFLNNQSDSAKLYASQIILPLYNVLEYDQKYNEISISFTCKTSLENSSNYFDMTYNYNTDSLKKVISVN